MRAFQYPDHVMDRTSVTGKSLMVSVIAMRRQ